VIKSVVPAALVAATLVQGPQPTSSSSTSSLQNRDAPMKKLSQRFLSRTVVK